MRRGRTSSHDARHGRTRPLPVLDLSTSKQRPAVVLAEVGRGDVVLAQITSKPYADPDAVELAGVSFRRGGLDLTSYVRPGKLLTANSASIMREVGLLTDAARDEVVAAVVRMLAG